VKQQKRMGAFGRASVQMNRWHADWGQAGGGEIQNSTRQEGYEPGCVFHLELERQAGEGKKEACLSERGR